MSVFSFDPISMKSMTSLIGTHKQVLVYGTVGCGWEWIQSQLLTRKDSSVERVFNYVIGDDIPGHEEFIPPGAITTLEGRVFAKVSSGAKDVPPVPREIAIPLRTKRICKAALVNWAFEVWRRKDDSTKIPLIFVIDKAGNEYPLSNEDLLSKSKKVRGKNVNEVTTFSEIRRLAKLCNDEKIDKEVRQEVQKNCIFVALKNEGKESVLVRIPHPWSHPSWNEELAKRKKMSVRVKKSYDWIKELNQLVSTERLQRVSVKAGLPNPKANSEKSEPLGLVSLSVSKAEPTPHESAKHIEQRLLQSMFGSNFNLSWTT